MDGVHSEEECGDEGQARFLEHAALARVHEQAGDGAVQTHIDHVEVQRHHAAQQDVQPGRRDTKRDIQHAGKWKWSCNFCSCVKDNRLKKKTDTNR